MKLAIVGDSNVGKTCLLIRFTEDFFQPSHMSTIAVDFKFKTVEVEAGKSVKIQVWDTAGQERFRTITRSFFSKAMGLVLVYDCTDQKSFDNIENWL